MNPSAETPFETPLEALYRHARRKEWGLAIFAWERDGHRAYQFEDGHLRTFAQAFYSLLSEVDQPADEAKDMVEALTRLLDLNDQSAAQAKRKKKVKGGGPSAFSLMDQVAVFVERFPGGFQNANWKHEKRGAGAKRRMKHHRDAAIADAQKALAAPKLAALVAAQQYGRVHAAVVELLKSTDLVSSKNFEPLGKLSPLHHRALALAVQDVLHGEGPYERRLARFSDALRDLTSVRPSWQLVTVLGALVLPNEQVFVAPATLREQARWMAPALEYRNVPQSEAYVRLAALVHAVKESLKREDLKPRDLMDVQDFIREMLKPASKKRATELKAERESGNGSVKA